ncbi:MAG: redoxin domain-containing protein [Armatimonadetes bacterium]|nr:redoxin domain-containing protein [Armatimonadota bacterium]
MQNNNEAHRDDITIGEESTAQYVRPALKTGHTIPDFRLMSVEGAAISPTDYKGRKNLVIIFFDAHSSSDLVMLSLVGRRYQEIADDNAEVLAISVGPIDELQTCAADFHFQFPLLSDMHSQAACSYCVVGSMIFVADKFGELKMQSDISEANIDEKLDKALSALELIELECPECGVSTWPVE